MNEHRDNAGGPRSTPVDASPGVAFGSAPVVGPRPDDETHAPATIES